MYPYLNNANRGGFSIRKASNQSKNRSYDMGGQPYVANLSAATVKNTNFRTTLFTGEKLQMTVMSIPPNDTVGLEVHYDTDQFIYVEQGQGNAMMGTDKTNLNFKHNIFPGFAVIIPAGRWHDIKNTGKTELKLFVIYAPPEHKKGTVHITKKDSLAEDAQG